MDFRKLTFATIIGRFARKSRAIMLSASSCLRLPAISRSIVSPGAGISDEQRILGSPKRMSTVLWDTFTGSAPYSSVLRRTLNPIFIARFLWELTLANLPLMQPEGGFMRSAVLGRWFKDGEIICHQGQLGDCLYVVEKGQVELMRREGSREFSLRVLGEGDPWGEDGLLERNHTRNTTARALGEVCVLTI